MLMIVSTSSPCYESKVTYADRKIIRQVQRLLMINPENPSDNKFEFSVEHEELADQFPLSTLFAAHWYNFGIADRRSGPRDDPRVSQVLALKREYPLVPVSETDGFLPAIAIKAYDDPVKREYNGRSYLRQRVAICDPNDELGFSSEVPFEISFADPKVALKPGVLCELNTSDLRTTERGGLTVAINQPLNTYRPRRLRWDMKQKRAVAVPVEAAKSA